MILRKKNAKLISKDVEKFERILDALCEKANKPIGKSIEQLKIDFEAELLEYGARETGKEHSNIRLRIFAEYPDEEYYDILGCFVYFKRFFGWYRLVGDCWLKLDEEDECKVRYSGVCGDVNTSYPPFKDYFYNV